MGTSRLRRNREFYFKLYFFQNTEVRLKGTAFLPYER